MTSLAAYDPLALEQLEAPLGDGFVLAVAATAHGADQVVLAQELPSFVAGGLAALVRVHDDRRGGLSTP